MADLLQRDKSVISKHIRNIFDEGELHPEATAAKLAAVQLEGEGRLPHRHSPLATRHSPHSALDIRSPKSIITWAPEDGRVASDQPRNLKITGSTPDTVPSMSSSAGSKNSVSTTQDPLETDGAQG
jgi:hypothetical protein